MVSCSFFLVYAFSCLHASLASPLPHTSLKPPVSTPLELETLGFVLLCMDSSSFSTASQSQNQEQVGSVFVLSTLWPVNKLASPVQSWPNHLCLGGTVLCLVAQAHLTLCDPMNCSPPGSSIHGILQARVLEWVAMSSYRGSSQPRDPTQVSSIASRCFNLWATRKALEERL